MSKTKVTISLDEEVKEMLLDLAKKNHTTISALITQFTLIETRKESFQNTKNEYK